MSKTGETTGISAKIMRPSSVHVYLAGPDVFASDAVEVGRRKKAFLSSLGLVGHYPFDNEIPTSAAGSQEIAAFIAQANERLILGCRFILIDMNPFRGPSMDVGTAFEAGFMAALAYTDSSLTLIGYTADPRPYEQRVSEDVFKGKVRREGGRLVAPDGTSVESFGLPENLMLPAAIARTGGKILKTFEEAAFYARDLAQNQPESEDDKNQDS